MPLKAGTRFYCVAEVGAQNTPFLVTERDDKGHVTYAGVQSGQAPLLDGAAIATAIRRRIAGARHVKATVRCPTGIPKQRGLEFVCLATDGDGTTQFVVRQTNDAGHVSYRAR